MPKYYFKPNVSMPIDLGNGNVVQIKPKSIIELSKNIASRYTKILKEMPENTVATLIISAEKPKSAPKVAPKSASKAAPAPKAVEPQKVEDKKEADKKAEDKNKNKGAKK